MEQRITYTNVKGVTYYLGRGRTKTGKPRYFFAREPKGEPVTEIPDGWEIKESVNGVVSLARKRPAQIRPEERESVEAAVQRHPKSNDYRVDVRGKYIQVYERVGPGAGELSELLGAFGVLARGREGEVQEILDQRAQFTPVLRFVLLDAEARTFGVERTSILGDSEHWVSVGNPGPVDQLAQRWIPGLSRDRAAGLL